MARVVLKMPFAMLLAICFPHVFDAAQVSVKANPIRKVVNMLEAMQKKIAAEGEKEKSLYNKFVCYCSSNKGALADTIAAAEAKGPAVTSSIEESTSEKAQLDEDLKAHRADRESAKASYAEAVALRTKQAEAYASRKAEFDSNVAALEKAISALEKGMAGFLQTGAAQALRKLVESREGIVDMDRQTVLAFLSSGQTSEYSPQSGQITGILKQIHEEMTNGLAEETAAEEAAIKEHEELAVAKKKEIAALTQGIEEKTVRVGEVAVSITEMKNDLADNQASLETDQAFLKELEEGCSTKETEWNERQKTRSEELLALAETIKLINNDDALELFKKAVPTPGGDSFVQVAGRSGAQVRARALAAVNEARRVSAQQRAPGLDFIAVALQSKTGGFEKVQAMIDEMVVVLKSEQKGDDDKKSYCAAEFDSADDKKKDLERTVSDEGKAISISADGISALTSELKALAEGIEQLDKSVAQATEQRKQEHDDYTELMALDTQAKELLGIAKNRLNKFYHPNLYVPPPKKELTQEEAIYQSVVPAEEPAFVQLAAHIQYDAAPPPPPETFDAYTKKSQESSGVIAMVDMIVKDLEKEMTEAQTSEKDAQKGYEVMLADAKAKRAADSKSISEKEGAKAELEQELESHKDGKASATKELAAISEYIYGLHNECDWLQENYDARKEARASEVESLKNAKAVLAGSDYSLVQLHDTKKRNLRG